MRSTLPGFASRLRRELCARNAAFATSNQLAHVSSYGAAPVIVYAPQADGLNHGNFFKSSYAAILKRPEWARRLQKIHAQAKRSLPRADRPWKELDSCMSSDGLLMNIFCCPSVCESPLVASMLGTETTEIPEFGCRPRVPLVNGRTDRTEIDMKLGKLFVEAKLTESNFQTREKSAVESYRDLKEVFDLLAQEIWSLLERRGSWNSVRPSSIFRGSKLAISSIGWIGSSDTMEGDKSP